MQCRQIVCVAQNTPHKERHTHTHTHTRKLRNGRQTPNAVKESNPGEYANMDIHCVQKCNNDAHTHYNDVRGIHSRPNRGSGVRVGNPTGRQHNSCQWKQQMGNDKTAPRHTHCTVQKSCINQCRTSTHATHAPRMIHADPYVAMPNPILHHTSTHSSGSRGGIII